MSQSDPYNDEKAIGNYWTETIYPRSVKDGSGKFLTIVTEDDGAVSAVEYHPPFPSRNRIKLTLTFIRSSGEIKEVSFRRFKQYTTRGVTRWEEQWAGPGEPMSLTHLTFERLVGFLKLLTELDLANLNGRRIALRDAGGPGLDPETHEKMRALLRQPEGLALVDELLNNEAITSRDLVNIGYRKRQLAVFRELLAEEGFIDKYREEHNIAGTQTEKVWQHFFNANDWIFGFGLDYRFLGILQSEAHVAAGDLAGRDAAITDFLLTSTNFTVLVEVKKPGTPLFQRNLNRANSWQLSGELVGAVSQVLEQKASWQVKAEASAASNFAADGSLIAQKTLDPKCLLIVGCDHAFAGNEKERSVKLRTFELFRRDSRNIEIVTYDELFKRAEFIVERGAKRQRPR